MEKCWWAGELACDLFFYLWRGLDKERGWDGESVSRSSGSRQASFGVEFRRILNVYYASHVFLCTLCFHVIARRLEGIGCGWQLGLKPITRGIGLRIFFENNLYCIIPSQRRDITIHSLSLYHWLGMYSTTTKLRSHMNSVILSPNFGIMFFQMMLTKLLCISRVHLLRSPSPSTCPVQDVI